MTRHAQTMTAADLLDLPDDGFRYELVAGGLRPLPRRSLRQARIIARLIHALAQYMDTRSLGELYGEFGYLLTENPDTVLAPDVSFLRQERLDGADLEHTYWVGAPDLAVEVVSPSDRYSEVQEKVARWLEAGTQLVWVIDPRRQQITVHQAPNAIAHLTAADTLDGADVLPGWTLPVQELFL